MPYVRCDVNCNPKTPQPGHYDVSQEESCLVYENYNKDYIRTDSECQTTTQPDILNGWNGDYIRVLTDGSKVSGVSQKMVEQTIYQPTNKDCAPIPFVCFNEPPAVGTSVTDLIGDAIYMSLEDSYDYLIKLASGGHLLTPEDNNQINYVTPATYGDEIYIASEDGADYFIELGTDRYRVLLEDNTPIDPQYLLSN